MKTFLTVCAVLALAGTAMAYDVTTSFKGTVDVKFDWVNFSNLDEDNTNCNDWYNFPVKYDAYLVLCYDVILCPICPFEIEQAYLWLINKRSKEVFYAVYDPLDDEDGIDNVEGYCFGGGNVGVCIETHLPYPDLEGNWSNGYATSQRIKFVLAGTREKYSTKGPSNILTLDGTIAKCDIEVGKDGKSELLLDGGLECADASDGYHDPSETLAATVSFKRLNLNIKPDPYCPECSTDCEEVRQATEDKVYKAAKPYSANGKYIWWEIHGENHVYPFGDGPI